MQSSILVTGTEHAFHLTVRTYTDPIQHLAMTTGLISLFVGNKKADTIIYTISVMGFQVVEHLMRTPGFTSCLSCGGKRHLLATGQGE